MKAKTILPAIFFLSIGLWGFVYQQVSFDDIIKRFEEINAKSYQEKIYLHTDKPYYAAGDTIWFKAYLLDLKLRPSTMSNLMYVELLNPQDKLKKRIQLPLIIGTGWGQFALPDTLAEGNYRIRAFTSWMRNFDEELFYDQVFKVGNSRASQAIVTTNYDFEQNEKDELVKATVNFKNIDGFVYANKEVNYSAEIGDKVVERGKGSTDANGNIEINFKSRKNQTNMGVLRTELALSESTIIRKLIPITKTSEQISVQFFPEGGDLISGIRSRIGFKVIGTDGLSREVSGVVKNSAGTVVARMVTEHHGMGVIALNPEFGETYQGVVTMPDGTERTFPLPAAKESGLSLSITSRGADSLAIRVLANKTYMTQSSDQELMIFAQSANSLVYTMRAPVSENQGFMIKLPLKDFPAGIAQFTLFNQQMRPLAERLFFVHKQEQFLDIDLQLDQTKYAKRSPVQLSLKANAQGKPVKLASFSVSVTDQTKVPVKEAEENSIFSELLLESDLKGNIEDPNYYFTQVTDEKQRHLDMLMLTQGWRRFNWQNIIDNKAPVMPFEAEKTLALRGQVLNNKKVVPNANLVIFASEAGAVFQVKANENGEFILDSLSFPDSTKFVIQARKEKGGKFVEIDMKDATENLVVPPRSASDLDVNINASMLGYLKNSKSQYEELLKYGLTDRTIMLDEVKIVEDEKKKYENSQNLNGGGNADLILTAKDLETSPTLEFALQGRVAGLMFNNGVPYFTRNGGQPAQVMLDGIAVEPDFISSINMADVETIEVLKSISYTAIYGSRGGGGLIVITTKRGSSGGFSNTYSPGIISYTPLGLFEAKQFYMPDYDKAETNAKIADLRSTIYWNPTLVIDSSGAAKAKYFNADGTGTYRVVVEGMDFEGHIGRKVLNYTVN